MNLGWHFEKIGEMGGPHDGAYRNPLAGSGLLREHKLAREAIQNSVDAGRDGEVVRVRFSMERVDKNRLEEIGSTLHLMDPSGPVERSQDVTGFGVGESDFFEAQIDSDGKSQGVLYIDDYGTHGLGGPSTASRTDELASRYYRLLLGFGVSDDSDESRGGSFGFGKSVYWEASEVNTVAFYSVFHPDQTTLGAHARLIVAGLYSTHPYKGDTYTGRAWLGVRASETFCAPLVDCDAHDMAAELGFRVRNRTDIGTSMMILGCDLKIDRIREGVENYWWPRIVDGGLAVDLVEDGTSADPPNPHEVRELVPYIQAYALAVGKDDRDDDSGVVGRLSASRGREVGRCGVVPAVREDFPDEDSRSHELKPMYPDINEIAYIRAPRMVVTYHELPSGPDVVGAFVADDEIDPVLKLAEPPDHTRWAGDSARLRDRDKALVRGLDTRILRIANRLRDRLRGETSDSSGSPRPLEELMGRLFGVRRGGEDPPPPPPPTSKVSVSTDSIIESRDGQSRLRGRVSVKCRDSYTGADFDCKVTVGVELLRQDTRTVDETLAVTLTAPTSGVSVGDGQGTHSVRIGESKEAAIDFVSAEYDDYALCQVVVDTEEV